MPVILGGMLADHKPPGTPDHDDINAACDKLQKQYPDAMILCLSKNEINRLFRGGSIHGLTLDIDGMDALQRRLAYTLVDILEQITNGNPSILKKEPER